MVQLIIDNSTQYRFSTDMATGEQQQPISVKKPVLRDLPTENKNTILISPVTSPPHKDKELAANTKKATGFKRQQPSSPLSPQQLGTKGTNGQLVYTRRKLETEPGKVNTNNNNNNNNNNRTNYYCNDEPKLQSELAQETETSLQSSPYLIEKPMSGIPVCTSDCFTVPTDHPEPLRVPTPLPQSQRPREHWKERYVKLQTFLRSCDNANCEDYFQRLRSMSPVDRSRHAYELEKRTIQLTLEEAKEMHKAKEIMNFLGKVDAIEKSRTNG